MFPARAGMSRAAANDGSFSANVPRASGDEPTTATFLDERLGCSPRERG